MKKIAETINYNSSTIESSTYQFDKKDLVVEFRGGTKYYFENVDHSDYLEFSTSDSVGRSFNEYIRKYNGKRVEENAETI
jgi:hypothetical protein